MLTLADAARGHTYPGSASLVVHAALIFASVGIGFPLFIVYKINKLREHDRLNANSPFASLFKWYTPDAAAFEALHMLRKILLSALTVMTTLELTESTGLAFIGFAINAAYLAVLHNSKPMVDWPCNGIVGANLFHVSEMASASTICLGSLIAWIAVASGSQSADWLPVLFLLLNTVFASAFLSYYHDDIQETRSTPATGPSARRRLSTARTNSLKENLGVSVKAAEENWENKIERIEGTSNPLSAQDLQKELPMARSQVHEAVRVEMMELDQIVGGYNFSGSFGKELKEKIDQMNKELKEKKPQVALREYRDLLKKVDDQYFQHASISRAMIDVNSERDPALEIARNEGLKLCLAIFEKLEEDFDKLEEGDVETGFEMTRFKVSTVATTRRGDVVLDEHFELTYSDSADVDYGKSSNSKTIQSGIAAVKKLPQTSQIMSSSQRLVCLKRMLSFLEEMEKEIKDTKDSMHELKLRERGLSNEFNIPSSVSPKVHSHGSLSSVHEEETLLEIETREGEVQKEDADHMQWHENSFAAREKAKKLSPKAAPTKREENTERRQSLFKKLEKQRGRRASSVIVDNWRLQQLPLLLYFFYEKHDPPKLKSIQKTLASYKGNEDFFREDVLLNTILPKYNLKEDELDSLSKDIETNPKKVDEASTHLNLRQLKRLKSLDYEEIDTWKKQELSVLLYHFYERYDPPKVKTVVTTMRLHKKLGQETLLLFLAKQAKERGLTEDDLDVLSQEIVADPERADNTRKELRKAALSEDEYSDEREEGSTQEIEEKNEGSKPKQKDLDPQVARYVSGFKVESKARRRSTVGRGSSAVGRKERRESMQLRGGSKDSTSSNRTSSEPPNLSSNDGGEGGELTEEERKKKILRRLSLSGGAGVQLFNPGVDALGAVKLKTAAPSQEEIGELTEDERKQKITKRLSLSGGAGVALFNPGLDMLGTSKLKKTSSLPVSGRKSVDANAGTFTKPSLKKVQRPSERTKSFDQSAGLFQKPDLKKLGKTTSGRGRGGGIGGEGVGGGGVVVGEEGEAQDVKPRKKTGHRQSFEDFVSKEKDLKAKVEKRGGAGGG
ncbi:hypothetical protein TrST_g3068 [Triparma strigata]|uniref:Uncharacterized protein n=1 Tax=Triparma strigata TaxID=1606541 RepID=A0A9W7AXI7_9STRA|nr:hypothetical protein TrST_g3068 [Triparma strigata]